MELAHVDELKEGRNLLAFSGGVDSSALFFLLLEKGIGFDMAFVNYHTRAQSHDEEAYARTLATRYNKALFIHHAKDIDSNFEHEARKIRYEFFESILCEYGYRRLLLAHQLNDRLEWLLLSLFRGGGLDSLLGSDALKACRSEGGYVYHIVRPLLFVPKQALYDYLRMGNKHYFEDESNQSLKYARNRIRHQYSDSMIEQYATQIAQSFRILEQERGALYPQDIQRIGEVFLCPYGMDSYKNTHYISKALKYLGYVPSSTQRQELVRQNYQAVIGGKFGIGVLRDRWLLISPYKRYYRDTKDKAFKERMRCLGIPRHNRAYLSWHIETLAMIEAFL